MNSGYIHINQAVKKYNKTRQTFYNYIKKGYVHTKKVNNKVFLQIEDIEKILNNYIELDQTIIEPPTRREDYSKIKANSEVGDHTSNIPTNNRQKSFTESMSRLLQQVEERILRSNKGQLYTNQQILSGLISEKQNDILTKLTTLSHALQKNTLRQRKTLFWMHYLVFMSVNVFVLRYIS